MTTYGPIDVHVVCPLPDAHTWGLIMLLSAAAATSAALGGQVHLIPYKRDSEQDLWELPFLGGPLPERRTAVAHTNSGL